MIFYFLIFGAIALYGISKRWKAGNIGTMPILIGLFLTVFVGYRYEVGVDWLTYALIFSDISRMSLREALVYSDPAYSIINWAVSQANGQVWHVNLICAALFAYGLIRFCGVLPRPGLALTVLIPILVISTAMGYTRQATAIGCIMLAFVEFRTSSNWKWILWLIVATLFHRSAIFAFPIFLFAVSNNIIMRTTAVGVTAIMLLMTVVTANISEVISLYTEGDLESAGAIFRIMIGAFVGVLYFVMKDKKAFGERQALVRNAAIGMIALLLIYGAVPSSTIADRIGVLLLPFQGAILALVAYSFKQKNSQEFFVTSIIISLYAAILYIWINFSSYRLYWINYENVYFVPWL